MPGVPGTGIGDAVLAWHGGGGRGDLPRGLLGDVFVVGLPCKFAIGSLICKIDVSLTLLAYILCVLWFEQHKIAFQLEDWENSKGLIGIGCKGVYEESF